MCVSSCGTDYSADRFFVLWLNIMKKILGLIIVGLSLNGCILPGEVGPGGAMGAGGLAHGQWKPALSVGDNYWMVEGRPIQAALKGAGNHCAKFGKSMKLDKQEGGFYYQVYFSCQ